MSGVDTIAAIATAPGRGGIGVVRISGPQVKTIGAALLGELPKPRHASVRDFRDAHGEVIDSGLALLFTAPASFTGEDVLELHGHGGPVVLDMLMARILELGARVAEPGEFSRRAFLNDKIDLLQAEAIADLIASDSVEAARAASRSMQGEFGERLQTLAESLMEARMHVEAAIDFPDDELDLMKDEVLRRRIAKAVQLAKEIAHIAKQGALLCAGMNVVIAGKPNAGKSSLLNALAGHDAAIVTPIAGTTRDLLRERIQIDGMPLHIVDTAGLRDSPDVIEAEGIRRARLEMDKAHRILYVVDLSATEQDFAADLAALPKDVPVSLIFNKIDLCGESSRLLPSSPPQLFISAAKGEGLDLLRQHLKDCMGFHGADSSTFTARRRHLDALHRANEHLSRAEQALLQQSAGELAAEELRLAQSCLSEITGEVTSDELLGKIFSSFCIGK